jgi:ketosteroid isomerase-like protein
VSETYIDELRRGYEALNRCDVRVVLELLDPDIEWHDPAPSPDAGSHRGRDSFERFFRARRILPLRNHTADHHETSIGRPVPGPWPVI